MQPNMNSTSSQVDPNPRRGGLHWRVASDSHGGPAKPPHGATRGRGRGGIEDRHLTDVDLSPPPPSSCIRICIRPEGKLCFDLGSIGQEGHRGPALNRRSFSFSTSARLYERSSRRYPVSHAPISVRCLISMTFLNGKGCYCKPAVDHVPSPCSVRAFTLKSCSVRDTIACSE